MRKQQSDIWATALINTTCRRRNWILRRRSPVETATTLTEDSWTQMAGWNRRRSPARPAGPNSPSQTRRWKHISNESLSTTASMIGGFSLRCVTYSLVCFFFPTLIRLHIVTDSLDPAPLIIGSEGRSLKSLMQNFVFVKELILDLQSAEMSSVAEG